ncbi:MAG TPA: 3',5'-cyclic-AMP phosphodiesterase [Trichocoleus sp.]|jgi:Icc protein
MSQIPFILAQVSDTHLFADLNQTLMGFPTGKSFQAVLSQLQKIQPDLLLFTGDISQDETSTSYQLFRDLVTPLAIPTYWIPGNHDRLPRMESLLHHRSITAQKSVQAGGWHLLLLNSMTPGKVYGQLTPETLDWMEQQLQTYRHLPTLIALHHPPVPIGSAWLDEIGLHNSAEFLAVIDRHPQVKLTVFGHIHQEFQQARCGVTYLGTPSTCVQFQPNSPKFGIANQSPGFRLLSLYPDGQFETATTYVAFSHQPDLMATGY